MNTSPIFPHFPVVSLIFPQIFFIFFLILVFRVGGSPNREGPGYATACYTIIGTAFNHYDMNVLRHAKLAERFTPRPGSWYQPSTTHAEMH